MELQCAVKCFKDRGWTVEGQDSVRRLLAAGETTQAPLLQCKGLQGEEMGACSRSSVLQRTTPVCLCFTYSGRRLDESN